MGGATFGLADTFITAFDNPSGLAMTVPSSGIQATGNTIFDGNIQSLTSDYLYSDQQARAVSVSAVGIKEALRSIYGAKELAKQLGK